jgi:hypothetical protein
MLPFMIFKEIQLKEIDLKDEMFRISERLDSPSLLDSLRAIGQLNPVLLLDGKGLMRIVCGFRRLWALERLKRPRVLARVLPEQDSGFARAFEMAVWDNLSHRSLNPLEKARVLFKLKNDFGCSESRIIETYLPILGLMPHENVLNGQLLLNGVRPALRACLNEGRLTLSCIEILAEMPHAVQDHFASLVGKVRLSSSLQKKVLGLLVDLAAATDTPPGQVLDNPEIGAVLADSHLSPYQKGEEVHKILYRRRNPRLSKAIERFLSRKRSLKLPGEIRITAHPFFEEQGLQVAFDASTAERFRELVAALQRTSETPALEELFRVE